LMENFYTRPKAKGGAVLRCSLRFNNLKTRLTAVRDGTDTWVHDIMASDPKIRSEIANPDAVRDFCATWLDALRRLPAQQPGGPPHAQSDWTFRAGAFCQLLRWPSCILDLFLGCGPCLCLSSVPTAVSV
jgi:hypothetical protein